MRNLTRSVALAATIAAISPALVGMGSFGGGREPEVPTRDYRATFTDVDGTRIDASRVTAGGDTTLDGDLGRGRLRVPFDNIARITFKPATSERDRVLAEVQLREGEPLALSLRSSTVFYGRVPSGVYQIRARDLRAVEFAH